MIKIDRNSGSQFIKVEIDPDIAGVMAFRFHVSTFIIEHTKDKDLLDILKIRTNCGEVVSLHFGAGVEVNGNVAQSNANLLELLDAHILI